MFDAGKTIMIALPYGEKNYDDMLSRFHLIPECYGQTDRFAISALTYIPALTYIQQFLSRVSMLTRDKNCWMYVKAGTF